ncbi:leukocyte elastase inhibitor-like isoform X1 [Sitodiplosis mosellana]|uniref:leukocyte elastase inhibitor-like isoform X1 n=1 Tax=Sitodiplosis mosellana TaxID=263140 RepID=UPI0024443238|nr:leukocyte elastase inhibitor-like isoform X1 [Sitodiplosis mosellana]
MHYSTYFLIFLVLISMLSQAICTELASKEEEQGINKFNEGISSFSREFYQQSAATTSGNIIISPFSVAMALSLLSQATNGTTFDELRAGLHLNMDKVAIADQFHQYYRLVEKSAGQSKLIVANQIFVQQGIPLNTDFQEVATKQFFSGVEPVDFVRNIDTAKTINDYVKQKTIEKIQEFVTPEMFDESTRLFSVNTIYLKSKWAKPFNKGETFKGDFYINENEKVIVDFMFTKCKCPMAILDDLDSTALSLPYANSSLSFVIVLPNNRTGLQALESQLANYDLSRINYSVSKYGPFVIIPKFKIESKFNLNEILKKMGMRSMFGRNADLGGLFNPPFGKNLYVADVLHKAIIEINEMSTEVAAATGVRSILTSSAIRYFSAAHPFVYFIWDNETKTSLFSGRVTNLPPST